MKTVVIETFEPGDPAWGETLERLPHDIYHKATYARIEARRLQALPKMAVASEGERLFCLPYLVRSCADALGQHYSDTVDIVSAYGYPGALVSAAAADDPAFIERAFRVVRESMQSIGACSAFLRMHPLLSPHQLASTDEAVTIARSPTVSCDLTHTSEQIWQQTRRGHQSTINKCKRLGQRAAFMVYGSNRKVFLEIYGETMARVGASQAYAFDRRYFDDLSELGSALHVGIVENGEGVMAACLFFECDGIVQAHLGGTARAHLASSPFTLLIHEARLWAKARGNRVLHLGGGVGGDKDSVLRFKTGYSRTSHVYQTVRVVLDHERYRSMAQERALRLGHAPGTTALKDYFPLYRAPAGAS